MSTRIQKELDLTCLEDLMLFRDSAEFVCAELFHLESMAEAEGWQRLSDDEISGAEVFRVAREKMRGLYALIEQHERELNEEGSIATAQYSERIGGLQQVYDEVRTLRDYVRSAFEVSSDEATGIKITRKDERTAPPMPPVEADDSEKEDAESDVDADTIDSVMYSERNGRRSGKLSVTDAAEEVGVVTIDTKQLAARFQPTPAPSPSAPTEKAPRSLLSAASSVTSSVRSLHNSISRAKRTERRSELISRYLDEPKYREFIKQQYSSEMLFDRKIEQMIKRFDDSQLDPLERWLGESWVGVFAFFRKYPALNILDLADDAELRMLLQDERIKYEAFVALVEQIDAMSEWVTLTSEMTLEELMVKWVVAVAMYEKGGDELEEIHSFTNKNVSPIDREVVS
jgi:hypothetical protein